MMEGGKEGRRDEDEIVERLRRQKERDREQEERERERDRQRQTERERERERETERERGMCVYVGAVRLRQGATSVRPTVRINYSDRPL